MLSSEYFLKGSDDNLSSNSLQELVVEVKHYKDVDDYIDAMQSVNPRLKWYTLARLYNAVKLTTRSVCKNS